MKLTRSQLFFAVALCLSGGTAALQFRPMGRSAWFWYLAMSPVAALWLLLCRKAAEKNRGAWRAGFSLIALFTAVSSFSVAMNFLCDTTLRHTHRALAAAPMALALFVFLRSDLFSKARVGLILSPVLLLGLTAVVAALPQMDPGVLLPFLREPGAQMAENALWAFIRPFCEGATAVLLFCENKKGEGAPIVLGALFSGALIAAVLIKDICLLGGNAGHDYFYASHAATSLINAGPFFQRMEVMTSVAYVVCEFYKSAAALALVCGPLSEKARKKAAPAAAILCPAIAIALTPDSYSLSRLLKSFSPLAAAVTVLFTAMCAALGKKKSPDGPGSDAYL